jgi:ribosome biogenesis GTPase
LGWDRFFDNQCAPGDVVARVVQVERDAWRVDGDAAGWMTIAGRLRHDASGGDLPAVGDWVEIRSGVIVRRLERRTVIVRKAAGRAIVEQVIAANVDDVFIVTSANEDFSERRLERYLTMIWDSGATPIVVVNKIDLADDASAIERELRTRLAFVEVVLVSALSGQTLDNRFASFLRPGRTAALVGSSGVGKSTIVNRLVGDDVQRVSAIRDSDSTGRHTTTARQLIVLPNGALLVDTPGMRELQLWIDSSVDGAFQDIAALADQCRFTDCTHTSEPSCAVRAAVESGRLPAERLEHYRQLQREAAYEERRHDKGASAAQKKRLKTMMRAQRALYRDRDRLK